MNIIENISSDDVRASLDKWQYKTDEILDALVIGLKMAKGECKYNDSVILGLVATIESGPSLAVNLASAISHVLVEKHVGAESLLRYLYKSKSVQGRIGTLFCLAPRLSDDYLREILACLISDKSKKVREMTVDWIGRNGKKQFLPLLNIAMEDEGDIVMKNYIAKEIALLSNGYHVSREDGAIYVTVASPAGIVGGYFNDSNGGILTDKEIVEAFLTK